MPEIHRKNGRNTDGTFGKGNTGKRHGIRHKTTLAIQALLDGEGEVLTRKAVDMALAGDTTALRLCLERLAPPRKEAPVRFDLPPVEGAANAAAAMGDILASVASGDLIPSEAAGIAGLIEAYCKALETTELETRIKALEERPASASGTALRNWKSRQLDKSPANLRSVSCRSLSAERTKAPSW